MIWYENARHQYERALIFALTMCECCSIHQSRPSCTLIHTNGPHIAMATAVNAIDIRIWYCGVCVCVCGVRCAAPKAYLHLRPHTPAPSPFHPAHKMRTRFASLPAPNCDTRTHRVTFNMTTETGATWVPLILLTSSAWSMPIAVVISCVGVYVCVCMVLAVGVSRYLLCLTRRAAASACYMHITAEFIYSL